MEFLAGEALGALIFMAAFWLAIKWVGPKSRQGEIVAIKQEALPYSITNDAIEHQREREHIVKTLDSIEGMGR